jgi:hypothetical protein
MINLFNKKDAWVESERKRFREMNDPAFGELTSEEFQNLGEILMKLTKIANGKRKHIMLLGVQIIINDGK